MRSATQDRSAFSMGPAEKLFKEICKEITNLGLRYCLIGVTMTT